MEQGWQTVEIDGRRFAVRRIAAAGGAALEVERAPDDPVRLRPWQLGDHLDALDRHAHHDGHAPRLDLDGLAAEVLARTSDPPLDAASASELAPLGLWWASGGDRGPEGSGGFARSGRTEGEHGGENEGGMGEQVLHGG